MSSLRCSNREVNESLTQFTAALKAGKSVACNRAGEWHCENWFKIILVRKVFALDNPRVMHMTRVFNACMDERERQATRLIDPYQHKQDLSYIAAGTKLLESIKKCQSEEGLFLANELQRRVCALAYRAKIKEPNRLVHPPQTYGKIMALAEAWKKNQFFSKFDGTLDADDARQMYTLSEYEDLSKLIIEEQEAKDKGLSENTPLQNKCFEWILRDRNHADIYAEYPGMAIALSKSWDDSTLAKRAGYFRGSLFRIYSDKGIKTLQMRVMTAPEEESKEIASSLTPSWVSINDPNASIKIRRNTYTVREIFAIFANKDRAWGPLEVVGDGNNDGVVDEWHSGKMASIGPDKKPATPIDLERPNWWQHLPKLKWLSLEEVQKKHPKLELDKGRNWVAFAMATRLWALSETREKHIHDARGNHAYAKFYIPESKAGRPGYQIQVFSLYPEEEHFPQNLTELARFPCKTALAQVAYPDPSIYAHERQQGGYAKEMDEKQADAYLGRLRTIIQRGRQGGKVYNMLGMKNCAAFVAKLLEGLIPIDLFHSTFESSRPIFPCIFGCINKLPRPIRNWCFKKIVNCMGGETSATRVYTKADGKICTEVVSMSNPKFQPWTEKNMARCPIPSAARVFDNPGND